ESTFTKEEQKFLGKFRLLDGKKHELKNEKAVKDILARLDEKTFRVAKVMKRERRRNPAKPFITSTLQQEAARKLNFRARKTMMVAQALYEGIDLGKEAGGITGLITYMRTDSTRISESARNETIQYIEEKFGENYVGAKRAEKQQSGAQDAHEAIRPTSIWRDPQSLKSVLTN